jgi:hypothetical protein
MNIDERIEALTMNLELGMREIESLKLIVLQDAEKIRALLCIAESRQRG